MATTTGTLRRKRARRGEGDLLRAEIMAAAERLLGETGDEAKVSVRAVADAVGVTPPSIYLHFPDKDALIAAVCSTRFAEFDEVIETAGRAVADPVESLMARGKAYVRFGVDHPEHYRILFMTRSEHSLDSPGHEAGSTAFAHLVAAVERCRDAGRAQGDAVQIAVTLWATMHGLTSLLISMPAFPWPEIDSLVETALRTLARGTASG